MTRALVLGGGGVAGIAWELGLAAGLLDAGLDVRDADMIIGTSAGAAVGAQLASGVAMDELFAVQLDSRTAEIMVEFNAEELVENLTTLATEVEPYTREHRARIGGIALATDTISEAERMVAIAARLPEPSWSPRPLRIIAVDALTGDEVIFDKDSGVALADAVAASCAVPGVWPPATVNGRRYIDGGVRSFANIDLADAYDRVLVVAPMLEPDLELDESRMLLVRPDDASADAIGTNPLDPSTRPGAAKAGRAQAAAIADQVAAHWR